MLNHYEKNKKAVSLSHRIRKEADSQGVSPLIHVMADASYHSMLELAGLAASYAEVSAAYDEAGKDNYSAVVRQPRTRNFVGLMSQMSGVIPSEYQKDSMAASIGQFNVCYHMRNYEAHGKHSYVVSEGLAAQLALTELRGLKCDDMRLPYSCLYLSIPKSLGFKIHNAISGWHDVEGLYISEDTEDSGRTMDILNNPPDGGRCWRICVVGAINERSTHSLDDALVYFTIPLVEGWSIEDSIQELVRRVHNNAGKDPGLLQEKDASIVQWLAIFRWTMNVMVYATTPDAEHETIRANPEAEAMWRRVQKTPKGPKRDALKAKLKVMDQMERTLLGASVKMTPALRSMFEHRTSSKGKALVVRTLVAGHWQRYATGEGRKERTWKFRAPFWRGPESGPEAESHEHRLG